MVAPKPITARTLVATCNGCGTVLTYQPGQRVVCKCRTPAGWHVAPLGLRPVPAGSAEAAPAGRPPPAKPTGEIPEALLYRALLEAGFVDLFAADTLPGVARGDFRPAAVFVPQGAWGWHLAPKRRFAADFAFPHAALLVEVEGQAHAIKGRRKDDVLRRQLAEAAGWRVLSILPEQVRKGTAVDVVKEAIASSRRIS